MSVISKFLENYKKNQEYYQEAARICAQICETNLEQMGIRTIVTSRAKRPDRLRDKLEKRSCQKNYTSFEEINEDIADLSGVRIALYFPGDLYKVQQFIESNFQIKESKSFPEPLTTQNNDEVKYKKRFSGYWAIHYRVYLKNQELSGEAKKYSDRLVEIQIASALMHAWAEVEHDLVYKPFSGELSYEEYQILDELNGLVLAGEIALQRLQKAVKNRVSQVGKEFNNHYELAMYLHNKLGSAKEEAQHEMVLGRVDLLFNCIKESNYNKPDTMKDLILGIDPDTKSLPVVEQIMDKIREYNAELYEKYQNLKQSDELKYQLETLHMNRENGNRQGEANTLANIGFIYSSKENYEEAIRYFEKAVQINHEIGGIQGEANQLLNLGATYRLKGDLAQALDYYSSALVLHRQISYLQGQANALGMMGNIFSDSKEYTKAFQYYEDALVIYRETNYKMGEAIQLTNLGLLYLKQENNSQALCYFNQTLEVCAECDYKQGEGEALHNIGNIYLQQGMSEEAILFYKKALTCMEAAGNQKNRIGILLSLGKVFSEKGDTQEAFAYYKEALLLSNHLEYKNGAEKAQYFISRLQNTEAIAK